MRDDDFFVNRQLRYDYLTQLYEREVISDYAKYLISANEPFTLALIDIDNFKNVNDGYGHTVGDDVICYVANRIKEAFEGIGVVGRFGGDEFIIAVKGIVEYNEVWEMCRKVFKKIDGIEIPEHPSLYITVTLGLSRFPNDGEYYDELFAMADKALYRGKIKGRSCFIIYLEEKHKNIQFHSGLDTAVNSMQMHASIFKLLTKASNLAEGIKSLFKFLGTSLMLDNVCIQSKKQIMFSEVYYLSRTKEFKYIPVELIEPNISSAMGIFYVNECKQLNSLNQSDLLRYFDEQGILSTFYAEISYQGVVYGYLRSDATACSKIWQYQDMDLLITAASTIGIILHYQNLTLDDLVKE